MKVFFLDTPSLLIYRIFNKRTLFIEYFVHVSFDESNPSKKVVLFSCDDDDPIDTPNHQSSQDFQVDQSTQKGECIMKDQN